MSERELKVTRDEAVQVIKALVIKYRDGYLPHLARKRNITDRARAATGVQWNKEMDAYIFALRALGDFEF